MEDIYGVGARGKSGQGSTGPYADMLRRQMGCDPLTDYGRRATVDEVSDWSSGQGVEAYNRFVREANGGIELLSEQNYAIGETFVKSSYSNLATPQKEGSAYEIKFHTDMGLQRKAVMAAQAIGSTKLDSLHGYRDTFAARMVTSRVGERSARAIEQEAIMPTLKGHFAKALQAARELIVLIKARGGDPSPYIRLFEHMWGVKTDGGAMFRVGELAGSETTRLAAVGDRAFYALTSHPAVVGGITILQAPMPSDAFGPSHPANWARNRVGMRAIGSLMLECDDLIRAVVRSVANLPTVSLFFDVAEGAIPEYKRGCAWELAFLDRSDEAQARLTASLLPSGMMDGPSLLRAEVDEISRKMVRRGARALKISGECRPVVAGNIQRDFDRIIDLIIRGEELTQSYAEAVEAREALLLNEREAELFAARRQRMAGSSTSIEVPRVGISISSEFTSSLPGRPSAHRQSRGDLVHLMPSNRASSMQRWARSGVGSLDQIGAVFRTALTLRLRHESTYLAQQRLIRHLPGPLFEASAVGSTKRYRNFFSYKKIREGVTIQEQGDLLEPILNTDFISNFILLAHAHSPGSDVLSVCNDVLGWMDSRTRRLTIRGGSRQPSEAVSTFPKSSHFDFWRAVRVREIGWLVLAYCRKSAGAFMARFWTKDAIMAPVISGTSASLTQVVMDSMRMRLALSEAYYLSQCETRVGQLDEYSDYQRVVYLQFRSRVLRAVVPKVDEHTIRMGVDDLEWVKILYGAYKSRYRALRLRLERGGRQEEIHPWGDLILHFPSTVRATLLLLRKLSSEGWTVHPDLLYEDARKILYRLCRDVAYELRSMVRSSISASDWSFSKPGRSNDDRMARVQLGQEYLQKMLDGTVINTAQFMNPDLFAAVNFDPNNLPPVPGEAVDGEAKSDISGSDTDSIRDGEISSEDGLDRTYYDLRNSIPINLLPVGAQWAEYDSDDSGEFIGGSTSFVAPGMGLPTGGGVEYTVSELRVIQQIEEGTEAIHEATDADSKRLFALGLSSNQLSEPLGTLTVQSLSWDNIKGRASRNRNTISSTGSNNTQGLNRGMVELPVAHKSSKGVAGLIATPHPKMSASPATDVSTQQDMGLDLDAFLASMEDVSIADSLGALGGTAKVVPTLTEIAHAADVSKHGPYMTPREICVRAVVDAEDDAEVRFTLLLGVDVVVDEPLLLSVLGGPVRVGDEAYWRSSWIKHIPDMRRRLALQQGREDFEKPESQNNSSLDFA